MFRMHSRILVKLQKNDSNQISIYRWRKIKWWLSIQTWNINRNETCRFELITFVIRCTTGIFEIYLSICFYHFTKIFHHIFHVNRCVNLSWAFKWIRVLFWLVRKSCRAKLITTWCILLWIYCLVNTITLNCEYSTLCLFHKQDISCYLKDAFYSEFVLSLSPSAH